MSIPNAAYSEVVERCLHLAWQGRWLRPRQPQIAAFDTDGTLWDCDLAHRFWRRLVSRRLLHENAQRPLARAARALGLEPCQNPYDNYRTLDGLRRAGRCPEPLMVRVMLEGLTGLREDQVRSHARATVTGVAEMRSVAGGRAAELIGQLRQQGFRVIVVSASPHWVVEAAVESIGMTPEDVIAGRVAVVDSVLTDGVIEPVPYGTGKIQAILRRFRAVPSISVGNGVGDLAMLKASSHLKLLVNPTQALLQACEEIGGNTWPMGILDLRSPRRKRPVSARKGMAEGLDGARQPQAPL
ncbi:MAG: HAD family hydrolase [Acidobacteriota bacterium]